MLQPRHWTLSARLWPIFSWQMERYGLHWGSCQVRESHLHKEGEVQDKVAVLWHICDQRPLWDDVGDFQGQKSWTHITLEKMAPMQGRNWLVTLYLGTKQEHVQKKLVTKKNWAKKWWQAWEWQAPPLPPPTKHARHTSWCVASQKHEATLWLKKYCGSYKCALSLSMFTWQNDLGKIPGSGGSVSACEEMGALGSCPLVFLGECQRSGKDRYDLEVSTWMHRQCWQR